MGWTPVVSFTTHTPECANASRDSAGLFPVHARWCPRGSRKGALREQLRRTRTRLTGQDAGPYHPRRCRGPKEDEAAEEAAAPRAPDPRGERVRPPDSAPYLDPSFQNTAPPSQPAQHNEDTRFPCLFWTRHPLWTLFYYFCLIKSLSEA